MNAANSVTYSIVQKWFACTCLMGFKTMNRFPGEDLSDGVLLPPTYFMGESNWMLLDRRDFLAEFAASRASRLLPCTELQDSGQVTKAVLFFLGAWLIASLNGLLRKPSHMFDFDLFKASFDSHPLAVTERMDVVLEGKAVFYKVE